MTFLVNWLIKIFPLLSIPSVDIWHTLNKHVLYMNMYIQFLVLITKIAVARTCRGQLKTKTIWHLLEYPFLIKLYPFALFSLFRPVASSTCNIATLKLISGKGWEQCSLACAQNVLTAVSSMPLSTNIWNPTKSLSTLHY